MGQFAHDGNSSLVIPTVFVSYISRVYQDAELSVTHRFPSQPVDVSKESNRPNTTVGLLNLDTNSVVFYVGGYPDAFTVITFLYPFASQVFCASASCSLLIVEIRSTL